MDSPFETIAERFWLIFLLVCGVMVKVKSFDHSVGASRVTRLGTLEKLLTKYELVVHIAMVDNFPIVIL